MRKNITKFLTMASLIAMIAGCTTTYSTGEQFVGYYTEGVKTSQQSMKVLRNDNTLYKTYDDEFIYDEDGMVMEHIQTFYKSDSDEFDQYKFSYQKIGDKRLPESAALNGVVYMEVEYEILASEHTGKIVEYTSSPVFERVTPKFDASFKFTKSDIWTIDDNNYNVPFKYDGKFVTTEEKYSYYTGLTKDRVLSLGFDNIILKKFYFSSTKLKEGSDLSSKEMKEESEPKEDTNFITYTYDWEVIGSEIIQNGFTYHNNNKRKTLDFFAKRKFDEAGRRIFEEWSVTDSSNKKEPVVLFTQTLTY